MASPAPPSPSPSKCRRLRSPLPATFSRRGCRFFSSFVWAGNKRLTCHRNLTIGRTSRYITDWNIEINRHWGIGSWIMKLFPLRALVSVTTAIGLTKEAVDDCETLDCLSDIVSNGLIYNIIYSIFPHLSSIYFKYTFKCPYKYHVIFQVFGLEKAPPAEDGFLATWVWYENIRQKPGFYFLPKLSLRDNLSLTTSCT